MQKLTKKLSLVMVALMTVFTALSYMPAKAATVAPKVQFLANQKLEYTSGDRVTLKVSSAPYAGRVQYRALLWNDSTKSYSDLWTVGDRYYTAYQPTGGTTFEIGWPITEPGSYRLTVLVKRAGIANSKTAQPGNNCDSFIEGPAFVVKPAAVTPAIAPIADVTVEQGATPVLPTEVTLNVADGTTKTAKVTWDAVDTSKVGTYAVEGTVEGTEEKAKVNVVVTAVTLEVKSVSSISNTKVNVTLAEATTFANATAFAVADKDGKAVEVKSAVLSADGKSVILTTAPMAAGQLYTLTVNAVAKQFVAKPAMTDKLEVNTAMAKNNVEVEVTFSANVDLAAALNAANYTIDNSLTVVGVVEGSAANKVVLMTSAQTAGKLYKLTVANVTDLNENALDSDKTSAYFGGKAADTTKPTVTAAADTNTRFQITITDSSDLNEATALNPANYVVEGLTVVGVEYKLDSDGEPIKNVVLVTTAAQVAGKLYKVTINNIADKFANVIKADTVVYFGGKAADTTKPTAAAASVGNTEVNVTFSDSSNIDEISAEVVANYVVEGLVVTAAELNGKVVTLTTEAQTAGKLYKITINNVADEYGNVIKADTVVYFGGKAKDTTAPTYSALSVDNKTVQLNFSEAIDKNTVLAYNFYVKDLGYALTAKLDSNDATNKTVLITTLEQTSGKIYTVEARNVANSDGTVVKSDSKATFAGKGTASTAAPKLLAAVALDNKTVVLTFNQTLATTGTVAIQLADGTSFDTTSVAFNNTAKTEVVATLATPAKVFAEGTLYKAVATNSIGSNGIAIATDNNALFGGVGTTQTGATVLAAIAVDNTTVKFVFDKAVDFDTTGTDKNTITLFDQANTAAILYAPADPVIGQLASISADNKELTVYFKKGLAPVLTEGTIYTVRFTNLAKVPTVSGNLPLIPDTTGGSVATVQFAAISDVVAGPSILALVPQSKYVVDVVFDRPVGIQGDIITGNTVLAIQGTTMPVVKVARVLDDEKTVRLFLDETTKTALVEGTVYTLRYTPTVANYFSDAVDTTTELDLGTGNTYKEYQFAAMGTVAEGPAITAIANVNANTVKVTLDQRAASIAGTDIIVLDKDGSTPLTNIKVVPSTNKDSFMVIRTNGIFEAGATYTITLKATLLDESSLRAADADVDTTFGGIGNAALVLTGAFAATDVDANLVDGAGVGVVKTLRARVITNLGTVTTVTTDPAEVATDVNGDATWIVANDEAGEVIVIEATDGSVAIYVVQ